MNGQKFRRAVGATRLACTQQTRRGMHTSIFSHTQMTTRAGGLDHVRVESGRDRARKMQTDSTNNFQQFLNGCRSQRVIQCNLVLAVYPLTTDRVAGDPRELSVELTKLSPRRRRFSAGLNVTDTPRHTYIDFPTYSDDHPSRQSGSCPSRERSRTSTKDTDGHY